MTVTAIKDFKIKESYFKLIEQALFSYLWEGIYKPMFEILNLEEPKKARNAQDDAIIEALRSGNIYYSDGGFKAKKRFTSLQSRILKQWGAIYDKYAKMWRLPMDKIPNNISVFLTDLQIQDAQRFSQIQMFLSEVQANMPYIVESMVFDNEVITILDDAGNEVKKNVKHLNIIEPELSEKQKKEIARSYTENVRDYIIKDFGDERIPEMRRKIQELVLSGQRRDAVQKMIEQEYGIMSRKAKFLARNETSIMLAEYKKVTYQEMGFDRFIWSTIMDGKERQLHKDLNGKVFSYDNLPIIDERTGQTGLPGQTYNCRCTQIPTTKKLTRMP
nr:MAG TPA: Minor capsid component [Caudoviricetes sp.]